MKDFRLPEGVVGLARGALRGLALVLGVAARALVVARAVLPGPTTPLAVAPGGADHQNNEVGSGTEVPAASGRRPD